LIRGIISSLYLVNEYVRLREKTRNSHVNFGCKKMYLKCLTECTHEILPLILES
jgi:hypothetical protein